MAKDVFKCRFTGEQIHNLIEILEYTIEDCLEGRIGEELEIDNHRVEEIIKVLRGAKREEK